jgi:chromate transport protein ChrA
VVMHGIRSFGGDGLLIAIWAIVITAAWALLYRTARIAGARLAPAALLVGIGAISTVHTWGVRPQMLTLLLVVFTGMRLQTWRLYSDARTPWELIP